MPIGSQKYGDIDLSASELRNKYDDLICEAIKFANPDLNIVRADDIEAPGTITDQIIDLLINSEYVVADITYPNPNVFYELGIRHAIRTGTILIRDKNGPTTPFDLSHQRYIEYENTATGLKILSKRVRGFLDWFDKYPEEVDNSALKCIKFSGKSKFHIIKLTPVPFACQNNDWSGQKYKIAKLFDEKGEEFVALSAEISNKFSKLVIDNNDKYTIRVGEILDLGEGYALEIKQISSNDDKIWVEFTKDGQFIDDEILDLKNNGSTWDVKLDSIEDEDDILVLKVHFANIFHGNDDNLVQIQGLWLIDYENAFTIERGDEFGDLEVCEIGSSYIRFLNNGL